MKDKVFKIFKSYKNDLLFLLLFAFFANCYYYSVIDKGPMNVHLWRQTDCLSITRYYAEGAGFLKPEMNIQLADNNTTGLTAGEFPVLYYTVGMIWKVFGESYLSYRLFYLLILFAGLFAFYKSLQLLFNDSFWAIAVSALLFTSPVYVTYGISFLTDVPAFSFILIALYFLLQYQRKQTQHLFFIAMVFFSLAGLIKISSLIAFVFLFFIFILESFSVKSLGNKKLFKCNRYEWIGFASAVFVIFLWYYYASYYNRLHGFKYTFNNIFPIWNIERGVIGELIKNINNFTTYVYFSSSVILALFFAGLLNLMLWKRIALLAYLSNIVIGFGGIIYFILWGPLMGIHDYYYTALLILFVGIFIPFLWFVKTNHTDIFKGKILKIFIGIFLLFNFLYCLNVVRLKTFATKGDYFMVRNHDFVSLMKWTNADVSENWNRFETMRPYIRQIGIKKEDKIISLPDQSFNVSLYLVNQKGWTDFLHYNKTEDIALLIQKGAKYLFISDQNLLKEEFLAPFLTNQIGSYKGIEIFKLSENMRINEKN